MPTKINDNSEIVIPLRNLIALLAFVTVACVGYFELTSRISFLEHNHSLMDIHVQQNNEFRVKYPRGELGQASADQEQYLLIEHLSKQVEKIQERIENGMSNGVNITRLQEDAKTLRRDVETLKDKQRGLLNGELSSQAH